MSGVEAPAPQPMSKADPETLAIRARTPRVIRFRRGVIIGALALGSTTLIAIAWIALQPRIFRQVAQQSELSQPSVQPGNEALQGLPSNYGDVPKLGSPLPGDLGPPMLRAQQGAMATEAPGGPNAADVEKAERERRLAELKAARESGLLVQTVSATAPASSPSAAPSNPTEATASISLPNATADPDGRTRKERFADAIDTRGELNPHLLQSPASPNMLMAGSVIAASLVTGLNSDLPGLVIAQVTQNIYDSATGRILLVPQGARLIGNYDSVVAFGQRRALVVWQRLILPDGSSIRLDAMPASDTSGYAGLADKVDFHTWALLKGVAIATLLGVGTELTVTGESDLVQAIRESAQTNTARAGDQITRANLDIQPTIRIRPGAPVRLIVNRDLILRPWNVGGVR
ncbi:MAG: TrbI/VirB10 family protein [Sphingobium sp.]